MTTGAVSAATLSKTWLASTSRISGILAVTRVMSGRATPARQEPVLFLDQVRHVQEGRKQHVDVLQVSPAVKHLQAIGTEATQLVLVDRVQAAQALLRAVVELDV